MKSQVPHEWGVERRKWHIDRTVPVSALVAVAIALGSLGGTVIWWYTHVEARLETQEAKNVSLQKNDTRITTQLAKMDERWKRELDRRNAEVEKNFRLLRTEMSRMRNLLEQIAFNTNREDGRD